MIDRKVQKTIDRLVENKMCDGELVLFCTTYNMTFGTKLITVYGDNLFVTPAYGKLDEASKIEKKDIWEFVIKKSFWTGNKLFIVLKSGAKQMYRFVHKSWIPMAEKIINEWFRK